MSVLRPGTLRDKGMKTRSLRIGEKLRVQFGSECGKMLVAFRTLLQLVAFLLLLLLLIWLPVTAV